MRTNIEKWNYYQDLIVKRETEFINQEIPNPPRIVYEVSPSGYIYEKFITELSYDNGQRLHLFGKPPTRVMVDKCKSYYESNAVLDKGEILLHYSQDLPFKCRGAFKIKDSGRYHFDSESAIEASRRAGEKLKNEEKLLANGHTKCDRCRKVVPNESVVNYTIISFRMYGNAGKPMKFCSGECALREQYAHEG